MQYTLFSSYGNKCYGYEIMASSKTRQKPKATKAKCQKHMAFVLLLDGLNSGAAAAKRLNQRAKA